MKRHDVGDVLENLQVLNLEFLRAVPLVLVRLFKFGEVLEDIPLELDAIHPGDCCRAFEGDFPVTNLYSFAKHSLLPPSALGLGCHFRNIYALVPILIGLIDCICASTGLDESILPGIRLKGKCLSSRFDAFFLGLSASPHYT